MPSITFEARYGSTTSVSIRGGKDPVFTWAGNRDVYTYRLQGSVQFDGSVTPTSCSYTSFGFGCSGECSGDIAPGMKYVGQRATSIRWDLVLYRGNRKVATYFLSEYQIDETDTSGGACCSGGGTLEPNLTNRQMTGKYRYYLFLHPLVPKLTCYIEFNTAHSLIGNTPSTGINARIVYNKTTIDSKTWPDLQIDRGAGFSAAGPSWYKSGFDDATIAEIQAVGAFSWAAPAARGLDVPIAMDAHYGNIAPRVTPLPAYSGGLSGYMLSGYTTGYYQAFDTKNLTVLKYGAVHPHKVNGTCPYMFAFRKFEFNKLQDSGFYGNRMSMIVDANYNTGYYQNPSSQKTHAFRIGAFNEWEYHWESNVMDLDSLRTLCEKGPSDSPITMGVL